VPQGVCPEIKPSTTKEKKKSTSLENSWEVSQKDNHRIIMLTSNSPSGYIFKRNVNICPHRKLYMNIFNSIIHNCQKLQASVCE
jgi:hypothetical protein